MSITRRQFLAAGAGVIAAGAGLYLYATEAEPFWPEVVRRPLPVRALPAGLAGLSLVQLSDIHVGARVPDEYVLGSFERVAALGPDILVITGDLTQVASAEHAERIYRNLPHGRLATVSVLGNHDYGRAWSEPDRAETLAQVMRSLDVRVLRNEAVDVDGLTIVGLDDLWAKRFDVARGFSAVRPDTAAICLAHNPDCVDLNGWGDYAGWVLAGHTHGGQVKPPFLPPPQLPVENRRYTAGEFAIEGGRRLYINRGLGFLRQVRFNARPEITLFELREA